MRSGRLFIHGLLVRLLQFLTHWELPVAEVGGAHAPSPDVRFGPPGLRSLGGKKGTQLFSRPPMAMPAI
jgi:hypothetical protein